MLIQIISGVICSLIASALFAFLLFGIKPKIEISNCICVTNENGVSVYRIKFVNKQKVQLINVIYKLDYCLRTRKENISYQTEILPRKVPTIGSVAPYDKTDKEANYAVRISYEIDENQFPLNEDSHFEFTIQATHPFSNGTKLFKQRFSVDDVMHDCKFETGISMNTLRTASSTPQSRIQFQNQS